MSHNVKPGNGKGIWTELGNTEGLYVSSSGEVDKIVENFGNLNYDYAKFPIIKNLLL